MRNFVYISIFAVLILSLSTLTIQDAHAVSGIISDITCVTDFGGIWNGVTNTCTVSSLLIDYGETLIIPVGITLLHNTGTIENFGTVDNDGIITNYDIFNNHINLLNNNLICAEV